MNIDLVFALSDCVTSDAQGVIVRLVAGEAWFAGDPLVKARPDLFVRVPATIRGVEVRKVEKATQVPGEKRA